MNRHNLPFCFLLLPRVSDYTFRSLLLSPIKCIRLIYV
nr:MAG TPA: hypothetical protein [Caudoviricetes sp.]